MRASLICVFTVVAVACSSASPATRSDSDAGASDAGGGPAPTSDKVDVTNETLVVDGTTRSLTLAVPKTYTKERAYPLVLVFHGDGGDGPSMRKAHTIDVESGDAAIVAYPSGINQGWNLYEPSSTNKDMQFAAALFESLSARFNIDPTHVFGVGYSSGGYFINQVACRKNGFFRAIVVHAGGAPTEPNDPEAGIWPSGYTKCKDQLAAPQGGVATLAIHGANDSPEGGEFVATYWAALNGCQDARTPATPSPCEQHEGCPGDKPVVFCKIPSLGHAIWQDGVRVGWEFLSSL